MGAKNFHQRKALRIFRLPSGRDSSSTCCLLTLGEHSHTQHNSNFLSHRFLSSERKDPFARRPNEICDPYGQGGKPLNLEESNQLMYMIEDSWQLEPPTTLDEDGLDDDTSPEGLVRLYRHRDYMTASAFIAKIAAVGDLNNHFPTISLERKLLSREKRWEVTTTVRCHTITLGGLSRNDFHIAMLIDVETARPEVSRYLIS